MCRIPNRFIIVCLLVLIYVFSINFSIGVYDGNFKKFKNFIRNFYEEYILFTFKDSNLRELFFKVVKDFKNFRDHFYIYFLKAYGVTVNEVCYGWENLILYDNRLEKVDSLFYFCKTEKEE